MKKQWSICLSGALAAALLLAITFCGTAIAQSTLDTDGPYKVAEEMDPSLPNHTIYHPENLDTVKGKLPVVAFGNGACANAGNAFENYLAEISSYGFLVVADGPINAAAPGRPPKPGTPMPPLPPGGGPGPGGRGRGFMFEQSKTSELYETMDWAQAQYDDPASRYHGKLDLSKIAVSGQSCGGLQALEVASDPRVKTAVIFNSGIIRNAAATPDGPPPGSAGAPPAPATTPAPPAPPAPGAVPGTPAMVLPRPGMLLPGGVDSLKKLHTPIIYIIGGETDIAYKNSEADYADISNVPIFNANLSGVGHNGTLWQPEGGKFAHVATQWLLWQFKGDKKAEAMFVGPNCGLCSDADWKVKSKNLQ